MFLEVASWLTYKICINSQSLSNPASLRLKRWSIIEEVKKSLLKNATARFLVYIYKEGYDEGRTYFSRNRTFDGLCGQQ